MIGAIIAGGVGSVCEAAPLKTTDFPLFGPGRRSTDDSVLTVAVAAAILSDKPYEETIRYFGRCYPRAGYGGRFFNWLSSPDPQPHNSWSSGSAMRGSPVRFAFDTGEAVLAEAQRSAECPTVIPKASKGRSPLRWPSSWRARG